MARLKIGTHDSMTGERSMWISIPGIPFARTQSKTIYEQYCAGCRLFDLRTKKVFGKWRGAHGWWYSKKSTEEVLACLNVLSTKSDPINVSITYEGRLKNAGEFEEVVKGWKEKYGNLRWGPVAAKYKNDHTLKVEYGNIMEADKDFQGGPQFFLPLDGRTWHIILPIPWLWKQFYFKKVEFNTKEYRIVDFL